MLDVSRLRGAFLNQHCICPVCAHERVYWHDLHVRGSQKVKKDRRGKLFCFKPLDSEVAPAYIVLHISKARARKFGYEPFRD